MGSDGIINDEVDDELLVLKFRSWCWQHQLNLMAQSQLALMGNCWSSLAKMIPTVRANLKRLRELFMDRCGQILGAPQKPLRGRWGSASLSEQSLNEIGEENLIWMFGELMKLKNAQRKANSIQRVPVEDGKKATRRRLFDT